ncbi:MAG: hypothetical protein V4736_05960 [Bdellovibrionota bacterium]
MNFFKRLVSIATCLSIMYAPLAESAQKQSANVWLVSQMLKDSGWTTGKVKTYGQLFDRMKNQMPANIRAQYEAEFLSLRDEPLPKVQATTFKNKFGQETVRLVLTEKSGQIMNIEYLAENPQRVFKIDNTVVTATDIYAGDLGGKIKGGDDDVAFEKGLSKKLLKKSIIPSYEVFSKMTPYDRAAYFVSVRNMLDAAGKVEEMAQGGKETAANETDKINVVLNLIAGEYAQAEWTGNCIVAGYVGKYTTENGRRVCSQRLAITEFSQRSGQQGFSGQQKPIEAAMQSYTTSCGGVGNNIACNPFVYGFQGNGSPHCVKVSRDQDFQVATRTCHDKSPLNGANDSAAMIKSLLNASGVAGEFFATGPDGKAKVVSKEKYDQLMNTVVKDFDSYIDAALKTCDNSGEPNQSSACATLRERKLRMQSSLADLKYIQDTPPTPVVKPTGPTCPPGYGDESTTQGGVQGGVQGGGQSTNQGTGQGPGPVTVLPPVFTPSEDCKCPSWRDANHDKCFPPAVAGCPEGYKPSKKMGPGQCEQVKEKCEGKKKGCVTCGCWLKPVAIGLLVVGGIIGLLHLLKKKKKKNTPGPEYVPPAPPCDPMANGCSGTEPPPVVEPPPPIETTPPTLPPSTPTPTPPVAPVPVEGGSGINEGIEAGGTGR